MQPEPVEKVLCPVDFSDHSAHALRHAAWLARCRQSRVLAFHASWFEAPPYFTEAQLASLSDEVRRSTADAQARLDEFVSATLGPAAASVETRVVEGLPVDKIIASAAGRHYIVMGTHGRTGWNRWNLGSVAERVLRESPAPVMTVRGEPREIRQILCPVSDTEESRAALAYAAELASCSGATVTALHVREAHGAGPIADLCAWIPEELRARCALRELTVDGNAAEEIVRMTAQGEYQLLVLGAPRRKYFDGMVLGTTTIRAVRHASCPVLSVPAGRRPVTSGSTTAE